MSTNYWSTTDDLLGITEGTTLTTATSGNSYVIACDRDYCTVEHIEWLEYLEMMDEFKQFCIITSKLLSQKAVSQHSRYTRYIRKLIPRSRKNIVGLFNQMK